ncbi:MAG: hypothetical protein IPL47_14730 [Phyllobacteriaceae bacterium]|nr:hypothetical protein [Phyllobacteriaceae bacterium]
MAVRESLQGIEIGAPFSHVFKCERLVELKSPEPDADFRCCGPSGYERAFRQPAQCRCRSDCHQRGEAGEAMAKLAGKNCSGHWRGLFQDMPVWRLQDSAY